MGTLKEYKYKANRSDQWKQTKKSLCPQRGREQKKLEKQTVHYASCESQEWMNWKHKSHACHELEIINYVQY